MLLPLTIYASTLRRLRPSFLLLHPLLPPLPLLLPTPTPLTPQKPPTPRLWMDNKGDVKLRAGPVASRRRTRGRRRRCGAIPTALLKGILPGLVIVLASDEKSSAVTRQNLLLPRY
jgi:hypothetical protein